MINILCGDPGKGKTALLTCFAINKMRNEGYSFWRKCCNRTDELKKGGFDNLIYLPQRHTVYADYIISKKGMQSKSYYVDGFSIGLSNPFFDTAFLPPYAQIFLDEAQKYYNSRMSKYLRECVYGWYQLHRHNHMDVYMTCQRLDNIDINIRQIAGNIILVEDLQIEKDDFGRIIKVTWTTKEFDSLANADSFLTTTGKTAKFVENTYTFEGDIFSYYNSYANEPAFFDGNYNRAYDVYTEDGYIDTIDSFMQYNQNHQYVAPVGYWKNEKRDGVILKSKGVI